MNIKNRLNAYKNSSFVKQVTIMVTGTAGAQAITLVTSPLITRLYGPEAYGLMGVFIAFIGFIIPISALTYPIAIVLPDNKKDALGLGRLSLYISLIFAIIFTLLIIFFGEEMVTLFRIDEISSFLYFIPIVIFFSGLLQVIEQWLIRTKQFKITSKVVLFYTTIFQGSKVALGLFYPFGWMLISLTAFSNGMKAFLMFIFNKEKEKLPKVNFKKELLLIKNLAKKYKDFPIYRSPQVFLNAATQSIPILMLGAFFGPASAGFYTISRTALSLPVQLIGKSVGDVFYPRISEAAIKGENLNYLIKKATISLFFVGIIPFGLIILFGPWLFSFVFGEEWKVAGEYSRWLALRSFLTFVTRPSIISMPVLSAQSFHLKYTVLSLIINILSLAIGNFIFTNDVISIALFGFSSALLNIILILIVLKKAKRYS
ncbi:polyhydroxyalkanoate synthase [Bacillus sp. J14TS2]|uniref:lipopolysaccharide biosynthesis protein n=1 Tax=Bacillus sp. J14TS2 TaxID=2807188 RepID=UPI001B1EF65B|nr:oligosaccharide flippase family protein [Bacillus sp. J14TS2]GIN69619.1 polyhydroxyalkanoate synthase [Bacillus sp. J14TS2]